MAKRLKYQKIIKLCKVNSYSSGILLELHNMKEIDTQSMESKRMTDYDRLKLQRILR